MTSTELELTVADPVCVLGPHGHVLCAAVTDTQVHLSILLVSHYNSAAIHRHTCFLKNISGEKKKNISGGAFLLVQWLGMGMIPG